MPFRRVTRRFASWIAVLAVLMASLAPAISHALATDGSKAWIEVCTAQGSKWLQGDGAPGEDPAPGAGHALEHCPYCKLHPNVLGVPPTPPTALLASGPASAAPRALLAAPHTRQAWASAQPRAPPPAC
jgi:hypothetical protein